MDPELAYVASMTGSGQPGIQVPRPFVRTAESLLCEFKIHREDEVSVTSTQFCGGDWQWQLCSSRGHVLAGAGGFGSERECREAVIMLKNEAAMASVSVFR